MQSQNFTQTKINIENVFTKEAYTASKLTEWFILENLYNSNLLTDIRGIQYNKYALEKNPKINSTYSHVLRQYNVIYDGWTRTNKQKK